MRARIIVRLKTVRRVCSLLTRHFSEEGLLELLDPGPLAEGDDPHEVPGRRNGLVVDDELGRRPHLVQGARRVHVHHLPVDQRAVGRLWAGSLQCKRHFLLGKHIIIMNY